MKKLLSKIKQGLAGPSEEEIEEKEEYVEVSAITGDDSKNKIMVKPFVIEDFSDIKPVLDALREGYTICLVNIRPLKDKDLVELKRAVNKLKKTCDAVNGDIAGFGDDWIVVTPHFAEIQRNSQTSKISEE